MWAEVTRLLGAGVEQSLFPGAALCVRTPTQVLFSGAVGAAELRPQSRPVSEATVWDLASITKVLGATPLVMRLVGDGRLSLDTPLRRWISVFWIRRMVFGLQNEI